MKTTATETDPRVVTLALRAEIDRLERDIRALSWNPANATTIEARSRRLAAARVEMSVVLPQAKALWYGKASA